MFGDNVFSSTRFIFSRDVKEGDELFTSYGDTWLKGEFLLFVEQFHLNIKCIKLTLS